MAKERMNIQTIAEVLVEELGKMENTAKRIEQAANKPLSVDLKQFKEEITHMEQVAGNWGKVTKTHTMVDKWTIKTFMLLLAALLIFGIIATYFAVDYKKDYERTVKNAEHWYQKFNEIDPAQKQK